MAKAHSPPATCPFYPSVEAIEVPIFMYRKACMLLKVQADIRRIGAS